MGRGEILHSVQDAMRYEQMRIALGSRLDIIVSGVEIHKHLSKRRVNFLADAVATEVQQAGPSYFFAAHSGRRAQEQFDC